IVDERRDFPGRNIRRNGQFRNRNPLSGLETKYDPRIAFPKNLQTQSPVHVELHLSPLPDSASTTFKTPSRTGTPPSMRSLGHERPDNHSSCSARLRPGNRPSSYCDAHSRNAASTFPKRSSSRCSRRARRNAVGTDKNTMSEKPSST